MQEFGGLKAWQSFYSVLGSASATLVALLFVAASVGTGVYRRDKDHVLRIFLSPTVVHFSSILLACLAALMPVRQRPCGLLITGEGLLGVGYAVVVWRNMVRHGLMPSIELEDRIWYAAMPALAYGGVAASGSALFMRSDVGPDVLAPALCLLLLIGLRNAWDMTLWTVMRRQD